MLSISSELHVGAILLELIGNIGIVLLLNAHDKASQSLDMILECHIRPISLYEILSVSYESEGDHESARAYISQSDGMLAKCHDIICILIEKIEDVPVKLLEKAAKVRYSEEKFPFHRRLSF
jgi:hypothetical protein